MKFGIEHHAVLAGLLYKQALTQGGNGAAAVVGQAVSAYGQQRGHRMSLRAQADGQPLDMISYMAYGEWAADPGQESHSEAYLDEGHLTTRVTQCPWQQAWQKTSLEPYGRFYCLYVDQAILQGFNPSLRLEVPSLLTAGQGCCVFRWRDAWADPVTQRRLEALREEVGERAIRDWEYHVGHLYATTAKVYHKYFGEAAQPILDAALDEFAARYGQVSRELVLQQAQQDFDTL